MIKALNNLKDKAGLGLVIIFVLLLVVACLAYPLLVIWSFNTLFNLGIAYSIATYFAVVIINVWLSTLLFKGVK